MKKVLVSLLSCSILLSVAFTGCRQVAKGEDSDSEAQPEESVEITEIAEEGETPVQASPRKQSTGKIDGITVNVDFGSPSVKGRKIWGGLEGYEKVWRAGANQTTSIEFSGDVTVNGKALPAGKHAFFLIPYEEDAWIAIFNEEWSQEEHGAWGAFGYKQEKDVLRIDVTPDWSDEVMESLEYKVVKDGIEFGWEKARIKLLVKSK